MKLKSGRTKAIPIFAIALVGVLASASFGATPALERLQQWWEVLTSAGTNQPLTGADAPESVRVQCALRCETAVSEERQNCGGYLSAEERQRRRIPMPAATCDDDLISRYVGCLNACGVDTPQFMLPKRTREKRERPPVPLGSAEELQLRERRP